MKRHLPTGTPRRLMTHPAPVSITGGGRFFFTLPKRHAHRDSPLVATFWSPRHKWRPKFAASVDDKRPIAAYDNARSLTLTAASRCVHAEEVRCCHWPTRMRAMAHPCKHGLSPHTFGSFGKAISTRNSRSPMPHVSVSEPSSAWIEETDRSQSDQWSRSWQP